MEELIKNLQAIRSDVDWENCDNLIDGHVIASFDIIQIVNMIKNEYDIKVPVGEIKPANFNSAKALYEMIERLDD